MTTRSFEQTPLIAPQRLARPLARGPARARGELDVEALARRLRGTIAGEVRVDAGSRALYAADASNYRHVPLAVCVPKSTDDVEAIVDACRAFGAPLVSRAGGTSLAGQTCNTAVVVDWSKYVNRIVEIDEGRGFARVQPGVICDQLVHAAEPLGLTYGPCPATHDHCCYGGMLSNNSCGIHAQMAGKAVDNTEAMEVLLYDGTRMTAGWMTDADVDAAIARGGRVSEIHRRIRDLRDRYARLIRERYPRIPRRVSGYNLDQLLPDEHGRFNLARALVGSEGTLVTMLEMTVRLVPNPKKRALVVLGYPDIYRAADHLMDVLASSPIGLEAVDGRLYENVRLKDDPNEKYFGLLPTGLAWLFVEFGGDTEEEAKSKAEALRSRMESTEDAPSCELVEDELEQKHLWNVRESGLGATAFVPGRRDTFPGWEDSAVAPERLGDYLRDLRSLWHRFGYGDDASMYGHFGMGCLHCRLPFDLKTEHGRKIWREYMEAATDLVVGYGGSLSGEHGDGQARAEFLPKMFGEEIVGAFREFKAIFDPDGRMNPGRVVDPRPFDADLRLGAAYEPREPETHFHYPADHGSFAHATQRCVGIGKCRRLDGEGEGVKDTMCPSFMVTREEKHTTRGRAHALFEMLRSDSPIDQGWKDDSVKETLDLCLSCKGCKRDCPANVDMATYKAEFLSHYYDGRLRPISAYAFGLVDQWARLASIAPGVANLVTQLPGLRAVAKAIVGVPQARKIPAFAAKTFRAWFDDRGERALGDEVVLWADTFNNYFMPETAVAAVEVLEHAGFSVKVPKGHLCCGRPLYDYGMLDLAKRYLERVLDALREPIRARTPIVVLEPSCASVFRDELVNLLPERGDARLLSEQVITLGELLRSPRVRARGYRLPRLPARALLQGHCHHKAVLDFEANQHILRDMGLDAEFVEAGCCGMAGSFGYEKDKYDVSIAAGERKLLPRVREADATTLVLADGFSCKEQIAQTTDRGALHLAEALSLALHLPSGSPMPANAERRITAKRIAAQRRSMIRAGVALAVMAGAAAWLAARPRPTLRRRVARVVHRIA
ncbi:MAG TPA: FAD-linked oxidase C-terminal domain-containing protein [Minicystis sp.]|nr:FAD-linked oxidase C-terminal domain-containing protein [Minicystis sp.]